MAVVTGFGGTFLRANDPKALYQWYEQHIGLAKSEGAYAFPARRNTHGLFSHSSNKMTHIFLRHRKP